MVVGDVERLYLEIRAVNLTEGYEHRRFVVACVGHSAIAVMVGASSLPVQPHLLPWRDVLMRLANFLMFAATLTTGCAEPEPAYPDDDRPDPIYPANGWWQVVEREVNMIECGGGTIGEYQFVHDVWVRVLDERLHIGWGRYGSWVVRGERCPVNNFGGFTCPPHTFSREHSSADIVRDTEIFVRGGNRGGDTPMSLRYHRRDWCTGSDCVNPVCEFEEISTLIHRGDDRPPGF